MTDGTPCNTSPDDAYDLFVIGGGINGCGIARDAVGRGYTVCLAEMNDLASGTSSLSTKLIHGGLRYLEYYEFRLVREALKEREVLWAMAPHIIRPLRFVLPHHKGLRPAWLLRLGLFLYDHIGGRKKLPATRVVDLRTDAVGHDIRPDFIKGFEYSDCWVDDARLVALNARDAADRGADVRTRTQVTDATFAHGVWNVTVKDAVSGDIASVRARLLVNAAGPWVDRVIAATTGSNAARNVRLVQGSHIVVKRLYEHDRCYIFQNTDGRICFAIPYETDFTLIGTTDRDQTGDPRDARITEDEITYLREAVGGYFNKPVPAEDIVWTYSGVRPLYDDGARNPQAATRDYILRIDGDLDTGAMVNVFGGKLTTYRRLSESVLGMVEDLLGKRGSAWTGRTPLPGGDFPTGGVEDQIKRLRRAYPFLNDRHAARLVRLYGTKAADILGDAASLDALGKDFGATLYEAEVRYLVDREWARTAEDVLWRRTKLGLYLSTVQRDALAGFMAAATAA